MGVEEVEGVEGVEGVAKKLKTRNLNVNIQIILPTYL
jgi:hypothetical protein